MRWGCAGRLLRVRRLRRAMYEKAAGLRRLRPALQVLLEGAMGVEGDGGA
jgi:hypothetical protein